MFKSSKTTFLYCLLKTFLALIFVSSQAFGQDYVYSQYYNAPLQLNPAFAGNSNGTHININYRLQWPGLTSGYATYSAAIDKGIKRLNSGFGLVLSNDVAGDGILKTTEIRGAYSYKLRFKSNWQLKIGLEAGIRQTVLDWDKLVFYDQLDPFYGTNDAMGIPTVSTEIRPDELSKGNFDVSSGFLLYSPKLYAGLTIRHLNSPYIGYSTQSELDRNGLPLYLSLHGGYQITIIKGNKRKKGTFISPNVLFAKQSGFYQLNIGSYMQVNSLFGGVWLRNTIGNMDAVIFSFGMDTGGFKIAYSFDFTISQLGIATGGSHEMGISIDFGGEKESKLNDCLSLFR